MKPDWDSLAADYAGSKHSGVYDVDCTAEGKDLCSEIGVTGYPTIKYGDASDKKALKTYEGGRDLESLKKFAEENLAPVCSPAAMDACDDDQKAMIEGFLKRSSSDLVAEGKKLDKEFAARQKKLDKKKSKNKEKTAEFKEDFAEQSKAKPKKGKEAAHQKKMDALEARKVKLEEEKKGLDAELATLKAESDKSGVKLMAMVAKVNKDKTDL